MAAINPYSSHSDFGHLSSNQVQDRNIELLRVLFPIGNYHDESNVSAFLITASGGSAMLLLGDALAFTNLRNPCETMRDVMPVLFRCGPRKCSFVLSQAIRDHGQSIPSSPPIVALQIDPDERSYLAQYWSPAYQGEHPHGELARLIRGEEHEIYLGGYRVRHLPNTWTPPQGNPNWAGAAFESVDRVIYAWLHESNPNALQSALDTSQNKIDTVQQALQRVQQQIQTHTTAGRYQGRLQDRCERELADLQATLILRQNEHEYLNVQTVNSARQATLQCAVTMQVGDTEKKELIVRHIRQEIVDVLDRVHQSRDVSWGDLQINHGTMRNLMLQKFNALLSKLEVLERTQGMRDWNEFRLILLPKRQPQIQETFAAFCERELGHQNAPTATELPQLEHRWRELLQERFQWVSEQILAADNELRGTEHFGFANVDNNILEEHRDRYIRVLKAANMFTFELAAQLEQYYDERECVRQSIQHNTLIHLVKRVTDQGNILFSVCNPPLNPQDRPDRNDRLNAVHIPVFNAPLLAHNSVAPVAHYEAPEPTNQRWLLILATTAAVAAAVGIAIYARNTQSKILRG